MATRYKSVMVDAQETASGLFARTRADRYEGERLAQVAANYSHAYQQRYDVRGTLAAVCHSTYVNTFITRYNQLWDSSSEEKATISNAG